MMQCIRRLRPNFVRSARQIASFNSLEGSASSFTELPIIDIAPLVAPRETTTLEQRVEVGNELHKACRDVGFFYIRNRIAQDVAANVRDEARQWFALPVATKREILLSPKSRFRGYQPLGINVTQNQRYLNTK